MDSSKKAVNGSYRAGRTYRTRYERWSYEHPTAAYYIEQALLFVGLGLWVAVIVLHP